MISVPLSPRTVSVSLGQAWRPQPEEGFRPGLVHLSWKPGVLIVHAVLTDDAIFTRAKGFNEHLWELGDTFEMFLRPLPANPYLEFHVAPGNHVLQLRFPDHKAARSAPPETHLLTKKAFESSVKESKGSWEVRAQIPEPTVQAGREWRFSFSRYDAAPNTDKAILSSTSAHTVLDFHDQNAWQTMTFVQNTEKK